MIQSSQERVEHLQKEQRRLYTLAREKAEALTQTRLKAFDELNKRISGTLDFLNMPGVRMTLRHSRGPLASPGQDQRRVLYLHKPRRSSEASGKDRLGR